MRPRLVPNRALGVTLSLRQPTGQKPFEQLVAEAFDGPVLRLSRRIKLLETAEERHIRRGEALDAIDMVQRDIESQHSIRPARGTCVFVKRFAAFATAYAIVALVWCLIV